MGGKELKLFDKSVFVHVGLAGVFLCRFGGYLRPLEGIPIHITHCYVSNGFLCFCLWDIIAKSPPAVNSDLCIDWTLSRRVQCDADCLGFDKYLCLLPYICSVDWKRSFEFTSTTQFSRSQISGTCYFIMLLINNFYNVQEYKITAILLKLKQNNMNNLCMW